MTQNLIEVMLEVGNCFEQIIQQCCTLQQQCGMKKQQTVHKYFRLT